MKWNKGKTENAGGASSRHASARHAAAKRGARLRGFSTYFRLFLRGLGGMKASVQTDVICFAVLRMATFDVPRAEPATALAALSHMLSSGFLLVQEFFIGNSLSLDERPVIGRTEVGQRCGDLFLVHYTT